MSASTKDLLALSESILSQTKPAKEVVPVGADPIVDDGLKAVVVPDTFVENVLNFSDRLNEGSTATFEEKPVAYVNEAKLTEEKIISLVERLKSLIGEARELMEQVTTGMVGGHTGGKNLFGKRLIRKKKKG